MKKLIVVMAALVFVVPVAHAEDGSGEDTHPIVLPSTSPTPTPTVTITAAPLPAPTVTVTANPVVITRYVYIPGPTHTVTTTLPPKVITRQIYHTYILNKTDEVVVNYWKQQLANQRKLYLIHYNLLRQKFLDYAKAHK